MTAEQTGGTLLTHLARRWVLWVLLIWILAAISMVWFRWNAIHWFALPDTDDNLRIAEVRAWMAGQGWFDLRQYRLDPPGGANIHWSRLVDLPIAAIITLTRPLFGGPLADRIAVTIAPMLPLAVALLGAALATRRLIDPRAFLLGPALLLCGQSSLYMFMPLRIDHHGWQLAAMAMVLAGLVDPRPARGGLTVAIATSVSLVIGLEMMIFVAMAAGVVGLRWVWDRADAERMRVYALALSGGTALGFALFASYANRAPVCDALSPVWLSVAVIGGLLLFLLSLFSTESRMVRLAMAAAAGAILLVAFTLAWPNCVGRPEGVSPELDRLWLSNIREAKPIYEHKASVILNMMMLPTIGLLGVLFACRWAWGTARLGAWLIAALFAVASFGLLFMQARIGPVAQIFAVPGAAFLGWVAIGWFSRQRYAAVRIFGTVAVVLLVSGLYSRWLVPLVAPERPTTGTRIINRANARCPTLSALRPIALMPATTIMTFVDLGPRLIAVTHHSAIAGPYHRNGAAILDIHHAFGGTAELAHTIALKHSATMVLICPNSNESTIYRARNPNGFYAQLAAGRQIDWLQPVPLPKSSPFKLWKITR